MVRILSVERKSSTATTVAAYEPDAMRSAIKPTLLKGGDMAVDHVGPYVGTQGGQAVMVDAPHAGTDVQIDALSDWPAPTGAARPSELVRRT